MSEQLPWAWWWCKAYKGSQHPSDCLLPKITQEFLEDLGRKWSISYSRGDGNLRGPRWVWIMLRQPTIVHRGLKERCKFKMDLSVW